MSGADTELLRQVLADIKDRSGAELTEMVHEHSRPWRTTADGEVMSIELDLLSDEEHARLVESVEAAAREVGSLFTA